MAENLTNPMKYVSLLLLVLTASCTSTQSNDGESKKTNYPTTPQSFADEERFINDKIFRREMLQPCLQSMSLESRSKYGAWYKLKNCDLKFNGIEIKNTNIELHQDKNRVTNAFRIMTFPNTEYGKHLISKYQIYQLHRKESICLKYYQSSLPILTVANKSLCEAIEYQHI